MSGKPIKLFLIDGAPGGLTTAEITNWTGHALSARRSDLTDLLTREEAHGYYCMPTACILRRCLRGGAVGPVAARQ